VFLFSRKARIYLSIYEFLEQADSLNQRILTTGHATASFQWFFDK
jgi:hypothetical protein